MNSRSASGSWKETDLNVISRQRSGVFGLAILWIMLFHSSLSFGWSPLHLIKATGYAGVDVFLFLSGIGLFYSMEKDPSPRSFYKKRALRVLLPYLIIALSYEGIRWGRGQITGVEFLENITFVSYWRRGYATYWFLAAIVVFYLVYPLIYQVIKRRWFWAEAVLLAGAFGLAWWLYQDQPLFYRINGFVFRIPIFLIGCFLAPAVKNGRPLKTIPTGAVCVIVALVCWFLWVICGGDYWFFRMYLFIPLSISLTLLGSMVLSWIPERHLIQRVLLFFGGMTLELYLVHEKLLAGCTQCFPNHAGSWEVNGLAVLLAIALAWCLRKVCSKISEKIL